MIACRVFARYSYESVRSTSSGTLRFTHIDVFLQIEGERSETEVRFDRFHRRLETHRGIDLVLDTHVEIRMDFQRE